MKTLLQTIGLWILALSLAGCARDCQGCNRATEGEREYEVLQYSGGQLIQTYRFRGIVNNQENSDGYYWYQNDTLVEVTGDIILRSWEKSNR